MDEKDKNLTEAVEVERLSDADKHMLELSKANRKVALAQAEKALAENNLAEQTFKYFVLQLYMKYKLTEVDAIDDDGSIVRNAKGK